MIITYFTKKIFDEKIYLDKNKKEYKDTLEK